MALAFVRQQPFVASTLLGATTVEQLKINIDSLDVVLMRTCCRRLKKSIPGLPFRRLYTAGRSQAAPRFTAAATTTAR